MTAITSQTTIDIAVAGRRLEATLLGDGRTVVAYDNMMGRAAEGGVAHRLARYAYPELTLIDELVYGLPTCCIDSLVVSPSQRLALTYLNSGQGENGYELFGLDGPLRRLGVGEVFTLPPMWAPPAFSPSERYVTCAPGTDSTWWCPPEDQWPDDWTGDDWSIPSAGGPTDFATVIVHDLHNDHVTRHRLRYDLPAGWVPDDVEDSRWAYGPLEIGFLDDTNNRDAHLRLRLADDTTVEFGLPLPEVTTLPAPPTGLPPG